MSPASDKRDELRLLINSRHPIIAVETSEESRIEGLLAEAAAELDVPFFVWTVTSGLVRRGTNQPMYETDDPSKALASINLMRGDAIFLLKDFARYLEDLKILRRMRELAASFREVRRSIILSAPVLKLPRELDDEAVPFHLALPDAALLLSVVRQTIVEVSARQTLKMELDPEGVRQVAQNLVGLTMDEARRTAGGRPFRIPTSPCDKFHTGGWPILRGLCEGWDDVQSGWVKLGPIPAILAARSDSNCSNAELRFPPRGIELITRSRATLN